MEIITKSNDIILLKKFDKFFIRYYIGALSEIPIEYEIDEDTVNSIIAKPNLLPEVHKSLLKDVNVADAMGFSVLHYIKNVYPDVSEESVADKLAIISRHKDIYDEFYDSIIYSQLFFTKCIQVEGYSAAQISKDFNYTLIDAYVYLVYLREKPEEALSSLKQK